MLNKVNRLKRDKDFKRIFKSGKSTFDPVCGVKFDKNGLAESRIAVVVGLKVSKSAVKRNKIRRQYQEIIREELPNIKKGFDIIMLTSKKALELDFSEKKKCILKVLKKAGLLV